MPKFRSKPRTIIANQFHADKAHDVEGVCRGGPSCSLARDTDITTLKPHVHTMHDGQPVLLKDGDWVVPEPDGVHYYPIDDVVIRANYEPVEVGMVDACPDCHQVHEEYCPLADLINKETNTNV